MEKFHSPKTITSYLKYVTLTDQLPFILFAEAPSARGWCQLAYWELTSRVGRLFPVEDTAVNIFSEQPRGDGLDISVLVQQKHTTTPDSVLKARQKIGLGKLLKTIFLI